MLAAVPSAKRYTKLVAHWLQMFSVANAAMGAPQSWRRVGQQPQQSRETPRMRRCFVSAFGLWIPPPAPRHIHAHTRVESTVMSNIA